MTAESRVLLGVGEGELLHDRRVTGACELLDDVVDGCLVARESGRAIAVVLVGDLLQLLQVVEHLAHLDRFGELTDAVGW